MNEPDIYLTYHFMHLIFKFGRDHVIIYDKIYKREYKLIPNGAVELPFQIMLTRQE